ncbi:hypothetical protein BC6307_20485 [Sutcliffiella cohnii]|uniref:Uncharacterized protein n=1 Tax=Sutcliffiella cohnii TaxID=33932 RepID=A0A223KVI9_9BACI|nr:hypothetical protein BC6307_20485 [Sutcliffiella cohnii]
MLYDSFREVLIALLFWWVILLISRRVTFRYPERNSWKKDLLVSLAQSVFVIIGFNVLAFFL